MDKLKGGWERSAEVPMGKDKLLAKKESSKKLITLSVADFFSLPDWQAGWDAGGGGCLS